MPDTTHSSLLDAILDSWDRNNTILVNLLRALPAGGMDLRAAAGSWPIGALFTHMHYCRLVSVQENAPECARPMPEGEWRLEPNRERLASMLNDSAAAVREAVRGRLESGRAMDTHYDHPMLMLQHFIWHEGYHHGQIKLALKQAGQAFDDEAIGPFTWDVWMDKAGDHTRRLQGLRASARASEPSRE